MGNYFLKQILIQVWELEYTISEMYTQSISTVVCVWVKPRSGMEQEV